MSEISFKVSFMCQPCKLIFTSVEMYCSHKLEFHFTHLKKFRCIVFQESIVEPTDTASLNFGTPVVVPDCKNFVTNDELTDKIAADVKQEPQEEENPIAINNTVDVDVNISLENKVFNNINYFDESQSSHISPGVDVDVKVDVDLSDKPVKDLDYDHDPLEDFDDEDETQFETESTSTHITTETEMEYFNENKDSDSDDDITCLNDPLSPTSNNPILFSTSTTTTTTTLNKIKFECQLCLKTFTSSAQLEIHVTVCQLYNGGKTRSTSPTPGIVSVSDQSDVKRVTTVISREKRETRRDVWVRCGNCSQLIRRCHYRRHIQSHQKLPPGKASSRFVCQICGSTFRRRDTLTAHAGVHSEETPFKCSFPNCDAAFRFKSSFYRHLKIHNPLD